ncbi:hypothetical protein GH714_039487 [Hevea brasiliensis]|uniref:Peptidase S1 domain-containing protein n=1 Tax=Hevea brasiliensis TaxID=3981 RepID=A0A6A6MZ07_HEVBR|nr:hypothetical protein GH714_039487 [Hevea brasiliensis]
MEFSRVNMRARCSGSTPSEESALDTERNCCSHPSLPSLSPRPLQPFASGGQHCESSAAYFSWPSWRLIDAAEERANYFANLQKGVLPETLGQLPKGQRATTLLELMTIRAFHSKILRCYSLGTAIGFRIQRGFRSNVCLMMVAFVKSMSKGHCLVSGKKVRFSGTGLRPESSHVHVASQETYGTLGAIVRSQTGSRQIGFLTNRHVAVDLDYPNQKMFHPLPPTLGPGVYLGAVERATSFITDDLWYGIFAGINPETFVRADGAFIPFADDFDMSTVTTSVKGVGEIGDVKIIDLQSPISSLIGKQVMKVGRSSGLTTGTVLAYALEYNDEKGICFLTDFLVVGENQQTFDLEGDSGSLIIMKGQNGEKPRPIGIIWGGTANRGRLKLKVGQPPENWTSGVDLGRLLNLLELDLINTNEGLKVAVHEQRAASATAIGSTAGDSSPPDGMFPRDKVEGKFESLGLQIEHITMEVEHKNADMKPSPMENEFHLEDGIKVAPSVEHQFIPSFRRQSPPHKNSLPEKAVSQNLASLRNGCDEDSCVSLHLGDNEAKRRRSIASTSIEKLK